MAKSGSTLAFELTRTMLELAGYSQNRLSDAIVHPDHPINFVVKLDKATLDDIEKETNLRPGPTVIKTHSKLRPHIARKLSHASLIGQAVCRDPRDIALSMLDAAREGRAWGTGPDGPYRCVRDTIPRIRTHVEHFLAWTRCPNILSLHYEEIAFATESAVLRIAGQLGLDVDPEKVISVVLKQRFIQKNRAKPRRWKTEMSAADASCIEQEFHDFIGSHCPEVDLPTNSGKPKNLWITLILNRIRSKGPKT